jgi:hypothetical protein
MMAMMIGAGSKRLATSLSPGGIRSHDPYIAPVSSIEGGDDTAFLAASATPSFRSLYYFLLILINLLIITFRINYY